MHLLITYVAGCQWQDILKTTVVPYKIPKETKPLGYP